ncbi:DUF6489 family protein [Amaricoccus sp.]|uniref:DUF6489 family protein n=1 Tax=Amaricoccus sp. TaxID=1872485 RepID=UPI002628F7F5|nr:DUF6489 family protein [uncultured Amaricoccus sp.]
MKITVDVDCTPEEARAFLGLPDVAPMQERVLREMEERMLANMRAMVPDEMFRAWLPATSAGFEPFLDFLAKFGGAKRE